METRRLGYLTDLERLEKEVGEARRKVQNEFGKQPHGPGELQAQIDNVAARLVSSTGCGVSMRGSSIYIGLYMAMAKRGPSDTLTPIPVPVRANSSVHLA